MLQTIRERTQGWIAGIIVSIIILTFALWGVHSYFTSSGTSSTVAEVNGVEISKNQLASAYDRLRRQVQNQYGTALTAKDEAGLKQQALDTLIQMQVLRQASLDENYRISSRQIDGYLESMPAFQVNGQFSLARFQEVLASTMLSTDEFLALMSTSMLIDQPKLGMILTSFALPEEINNTISLVDQQRSLEYLTIPQQYFLQQGIVIPAEKINAYYQAHKEEFKTPEQASVDYIELSSKQLATTIHPSVEELEKFYNENINSYTQPMQWKLAAIQLPIVQKDGKVDTEETKKKANAVADRLNKGESFDKLSTEFANKQNLSFTGLLSLSQVPADLQKTVAGLNKVGQVSSPVFTEQGVFILKAVEIKDPHVQSFAEVKDKVADIYTRQRAEEQFAELREKLATAAYEHPDSLQPAATAVNLPIQTSELFSKDSGGKDISSAKKVRDVAFTDDVLNLQNNSDLIQISPDSVVVIRAKTHTPSSILSLAAVSKQIEDKLKLAAAEEKAAALATSIQQQLASGVNAGVVAQNNHLTWNKVDSMGRYSNKIDSAILQAAFQLPPTKDAAKPSLTTVKLSNGYAIVVLKSIKNGANMDKKQYPIFAEQVQNSQGLLEYELYKESLMKKAKIEIE